MRDEFAVAPYTAALEGAGEARPNIETIRRFMRRTIRYPGQLAVSIVCMLLATAATLAGPRIVGWLIDHAILPQDRKQLGFYIALFALAELVRHVCSAAQAALFSKLGQEVLHDIRVELLEKMLRLDMQTLDRVQSGQLVSRLTADTAALGQVFTAGVVRIIERLLVVIGIVLVLITLDPLLAALTLGLFPVLFVAAFFMSREIYKATRALRGAVGGVTAFLTECVSGRVVVAAFDIAHIQQRRFKLLSHFLALAQRRPAFLNALFHPGMTLVNAATVALLIWIGGNRVLADTLELGVLVAFISYVLWVFWPIIHIVNQWNILIGGVASAERVFEVFDWPTEASSGKTQNVECRGAIRFDRVWFAYHGEDWVLKDVSFEVQPGERIAIVGPTGSGKSTILGLLFGFYTPQRGEISLDGKLISEWSLEQLREKLGLVQQDGALFKGSIEQNISMFGARPSAAEVGDESRLLNNSGRSVTELSAGERQWVAFLRAAARRPAVWILDEAASHLDPQLDAQLHGLVERERRGGTVIVVAHRLSSVRDMHRIIVLYQGRIVEMGTHTDLITKGGLYAHLVELQEAGAGKAV